MGNNALLLVVCVALVLIALYGGIVGVKLNRDLQTRASKQLKWCFIIFGVLLLIGAALALPLYLFIGLGLAQTLPMSLRLHVDGITQGLFLSYPLFYLVSILNAPWMLVRNHTKPALFLAYLPALTWIILIITAARILSH